MISNAREEAERVATELTEKTEQELRVEREQVARTKAETEKQANEALAKARTEAREITSEAHVVAHEVLTEGTEISHNLDELSQSLHTNAERLLRGVRLAHGGMTARLDQVVPDTAPTAKRGEKGKRQPDNGSSDELDVPEFLPKS